MLHASRALRVSRALRASHGFRAARAFRSLIFFDLSELIYNVKTHKTKRASLYKLSQGPLIDRKRKVKVKKFAQHFRSTFCATMLHCQLLRWFAACIPPTILA